jgi:uncharacterized membrane protein (UPF0127 family)
LLTAPQKQDPTVQINNYFVKVIIADTPEEHSRGLSYRSKLEENTGMLFIFNEIGTKTFWMREMLFDIDIVWIDENQKVIGFQEKIDKASYNKESPNHSKLYNSPPKTKYVLELNSGDVKRLNILIGDKLNFNF